MQRKNNESVWKILGCVNYIHAGEVPLFVTTNKDRPEGCKIAVIPDHKAKAHRGGADTRRSAETGGSKNLRNFWSTAIFQVYNTPVRILNVDKQAVSGVPELHWRRNEHHFLQRRAARQRPTEFRSTWFQSTKDHHDHNPREEAAA